MTTRQIGHIEPRRVPPGRRSWNFSRSAIVVLLALGSASFPARSPDQAPRQPLPVCRQPTTPSADASSGLSTLTASQECAGTQVGIAIISLKSDSLIFAHHALNPMIPASNQKLLVTAASWSQWDSLVVPLRYRRGRAAATTVPTAQLATRRTAARRDRRRVRGAPAVAAPPALVGGQDSLTGLPGFDLLCRILKWSDNNLANRLATGLAERDHEPLQQVVQNWLQHNNIWSGGLNLVDGSGRSPANRIAPLSIAQTLRAMYDAERQGAWLRSLPRAGIDGTLRHHSFGLWERVMAKTGNIDGAWSLSGYLCGVQDTFAFSILLNDSYSKATAFEFFGKVLRQIDRRVHVENRTVAATRRKQRRHQG
jgi:D-alanyl-D-alanine carboxypeptidase/D-alanyl-D-alanine-endopeptidase (penicillin-binding protein 4)